MSMYNMLHGTNPFAQIWMTMLGIEPGQVGRFRDCYLTKEEDGKYRIHVYTRNGGGNREQYQEVIDALAKHPEYVRDFDDDFDCTYATIVFNFPEKYVDLVPELEKMAETRTPRQKWDEMLTKLQNLKPGETPDDPHLKKVLEAGRELFSKIEESFKNPSPDGKVTKIEV